MSLGKYKQAIYERGAMKRNLLLIVVIMGMASGALAQQTQQVPATKVADNCANLPEVEQHVVQLEKTLEDWANLSRYREANKGVAAPAKDEKRAVFMGDSITEGWLNPKFGEFFPGSPTLAEESVDRPHRRCWFASGQMCWRWNPGWL